MRAQRLVVVRKQDAGNVAFGLARAGLGERMEG